MKAKITKGNNFKGVLEYALNKKKGAEIIGGNMLGTSPGELAREFESISRLRKIKNPVYHKSLSQPPGEHNRLSDEQWSAIVKRDLEKSGFDTDKTQYVIIRHKDKEHDHVHVVINKVNCDGRVFKDGNDVYRAIQTTQELEKEFNLTRTPGREKPAKKRPSRAEREKARRMGQQQTPRERLQDIIDAALADGKTLSAREFRDRLEGRGVAVHANLAETGRMNGFSYQIDGLYFKSSALGKKYSYQSLKNRGLTFDQSDRNAFSKNRHTGEYEHESGDITTIPTIRENSVLDMHVFCTAKIFDAGQERAGDAAVLRQNKITHPLGQPTQAGGVQHLGIKVKQSPETKAVRPPQAAPAPAAAGRPLDPQKAPPPSPTKAELSDSDARKAKAAFTHIIAALQYRQPGHKELRQSLPDFLLVHADRIVKMKDYAKQQQATKELFKSDDGIKIANMILNNDKRKDISK